MQNTATWLAIGEVREGAEADVALALSHDAITIAPSDLANGRHVIIAREEFNGELRDPRLVSVSTVPGAEVARFWNIDHRGVARIARSAFLDFAEGVSYERASGRIFVDRPLDAQREPEPIVVATVTRAGVESERWPDDTPKGQGIIVGTPTGVDRRVRDLTLIVHDEERRIVAQRQMTAEAITALYLREDMELSADVRIVGVGRSVGIELTHAIARSAVHAIEDTLLPGAGAAHRAIEALERAETIHDLTHDAPHLQRGKVAREHERSMAHERELDFG